MATEKRTLDILTRLQDFVTKPAAKMRKSIKAFTDSARARFNSIAKSVTSLKSILAGLAVVVAARKLAGGIKNAADGLAELAQMADRIGVTVESLSALQAIAADNGLTFEDLGSAMDAFSVSVEQAKQGSESKILAMARLGIRYADVAGKQVDLNELLRKMQRNFNDAGDATAKSLALQELYSGAGAKLIPILKLTNDEFDRQIALAKAGGFVFKREQTDQAVKFASSLAGVQRTLKALAQQIFLDVAPALTEALENLRLFIIENKGGFRDELKKTATNIADFVLEVSKNLDVLVHSFSGTLSAVGAITKGLESATLGLVGMFRRISGASDAAIISADNAAEAAAEIAKKRFDAILESFEKAQEGIIQRLQNSKDRIAQIGKDVRTAIGQGAGVQVFGSAPGTPGFIDGIITALETMIERFKDANAAGIRFANDVAGAIDGSLTAAINDYVEGTKSASAAVKDLGKNILDEIQKIIIKTIILRAVGGAGSAISSLFVEEKADGGVTGPIGEPERLPRRFYSRGGVARSPQVAVFAEAGQPEAFVPLPDGRSIPVTLAGGGGGGNTIVNVINRVSAIDSRGVAQWFHANRGNITAEVDRAMATRSSTRQAVRRVR